MPFAKQTIKTSKSQKAIASALQKSFDVSTYKDQLQLSLKREAGNIGVIRVLFPKIKTYLKKEDGKAKCTMKMEWVGAIILFCAVFTFIGKYAFPDKEIESIPDWSFIAIIAWYLLYSFISIAKIKKALKPIAHE